ncbi:hypothetical protein EP7_003796 [Isosphaeraceae bacterium EP7]
MDDRRTLLHADRWAFMLAMLLVSAHIAGAADDEPGATDLSMTEAVVCSTIHGFEDFEARSSPSLTADEKLLVYYKPLNYRVDSKGERYFLHLTQDGQIRRRGSKTVIWKKSKLLDYDVDTTKSPGTVYLTNTVALKQLRPGEYEYEIILRDERDGGQVATQVVKFEVVPPATTVRKTTPDASESKGR